jgi:AcrR family transcriptional regulator
MNLRDQLLAAAAQVYAEVGYRGATTRRIAFQAGVNEITLFRHFGSKDALLREAIDRAGGALLGNALPETPGDPLEELTQWARSHIAALRQRRSLIRTCMWEIEEHPGLVSSSLESPPAQAARMLTGYLRRLRALEIATADFDEEVAAALLMGALFGDAMGRDVVPEMFRTDPEQSLTEYVRLFVRAIGVHVPGPKAYA